MVNNKNEINEVIEDITDEQTDTTETEIEEIENLEAGKLQVLKKKLKQAEEDKRSALEELATVKADFLNARKRLEEDTKRQIQRRTARQLEALLPLADSFYMAMANKEVWEKADENWRKGIEGINAQLLRILSDAGVESVDPLGQTFDPNLHEAIGTTEVDDEQVDKVVQVMQMGYIITHEGITTTLRPARVTTGIATTNK